MSTQHRGKPIREGWSRLSEPGKKCDAHYRHDATGWQVRHCGHPTANYPYWAIDPTDPEERCCVTHNGHGVRTLQLAFEQVEGVIAGRRVATNDGCGPLTRRIMQEGQA